MSSSRLKQDFLQQVNDLYEVEMGDFKRKLVTYLNRFEEDLNEPQLKETFFKIKTFLICNKTRDIEILRSHLLEEVKQNF